MEQITMKVCPKCGYARSPNDTAPGYECPKCGIVYEKFLSASKAINEPKRNQGTPPVSSRSPLRSPTDVVDSSDAKTEDGSTKTESGKKNIVEAFVLGGVAGVVTGVLMIIVGSILTVTLIGSIIGIPLIIAGIWGMVGGPLIGVLTNRKAIKGPCPYCGTTVLGQSTDAGITCKACKKRIVLRDKRFCRVD